MKTYNGTLRPLLLAGLLIGTGLATRADDTVTFQVDLSRFTNSAGEQAATLVDVRGAMNGWSAGWTLYNNGANVYTNTFVVTGNAGDKLQYKFTYSTCAGTVWEDNNPPPGPGQPPDEGNNRVLLLVAGAQTLPVVPMYAPGVTPPINLIGVNVTYRVDMTAQIQNGSFIPSSGVDTIRVTGAPGALTSWGNGVDLTNNPALSGDTSNIYSAVISICGTPGGRGGDFKFRMNGGWEDTADGANRNFTITGSELVLPVYYYSDRPPGPTTNAIVTFQVDMTPQVITGGFTNGVNLVSVSGNMNNWSQTQLTNDPSLLGMASNVYSMTISFDNTVGMWVRYKFRLDNGWESAAIYGVGGNKDRRFFVQGGEQVLPLVTYNDASVCDLLTQPTAVTFVLQLTNGTPDRNAIPFDKANDTVYINGPLFPEDGWPAWNTDLPQLTNHPVGSDFYQTTIVIPTGRSRATAFKFGLSGPNHGGLDNEAPQFTDHLAYIRTTGPAYTMPVAQFGTAFEATRVEQQWGKLAVGPPTGGSIPVTWLGCPCVTLQTKSSLGSGSWTDLPATDSASATNWPNTGGEQYFRLQKRPLP